jgi:glyoxylase-like metal-dependent hydrolase (beta-lactamase superfamily II)
LRQVIVRLILAVVMASSTVTGCVERIVEPADVFGDIHQGETYGPESNMIDDWYAVEAIDPQTFAINEPKSSQYNTSYLLVGEAQALMFDAGSGERPAGSRSMREVAERYTGNKPITLILSHFHYDHIHDAAAFDGVTLIDRPDIRAAIKNGIYTIDPLESHGMSWRPLKFADFVADGEGLDLGGRSVEVINLPGHTTESVVLFDRRRNHTFTGDLVYRHLGGIIAFASGSDLTAYKESSTRLLHLTNANTLFFGAHGIPRFDRAWVALLDHELDKIIKETASYRYAAHYLAPGIPWRVYQNGDLYIYTTPLVDPPVFWSKWTGLLVVTIGFLLLYLLSRIISPRS